MTMFAGLLARLALGTGLSPRVLKILGLVSIGAVALLSGLLWLHLHDRGVVDLHETKITAQLQTQARAADQQLVERRDAERTTQAEQRKEFDDATAHLAKSGLTDRQHVDACRQLRRQGEPEAVLAHARCL